MGSRHDFVERNNFIVLEYREKDPLDVTLWLKADATNEHPECVIKDMPEEAVGLEKCKWTVNALPVSVLYGKSSPGGLLNMVSKRPTTEPLKEVQFKAGTDSLFQTGFDFSDALDDDGVYSYRLTGLARSANAQQKGAVLHDKGIHTVLITLGSRGVWASVNGEGQRVPGFIFSNIRQTMVMSENDDVFIG